MSDKETALAIIQNAQKNGALVFTDMQHLGAKTELYKTEVTVLQFSEGNFHTISGKKMLKKAEVDQVGEASGIQFIQAACRVTTETQKDDLCGEHIIYRAEAQGKVRMSDGSWRFSTVDEYEFDPVLRAMIDKKVDSLKGLPDAKKAEVNRLIMEYKKTARQRAATGARSRVIRQLTGMPIAFEPKDAFRPMVFTRVVQNTDYILKTPEGRAMATAQALGVDMGALFGKNTLSAPEAEAREMRDVTPPSGDTPAEGGAASLADAAASEEPDFPDDPDSPKEPTEFERLTNALMDFAEGYRDTLDVKIGDGRNPYEMAMAELNDPNATVESRSSMIGRLRTWLKKKGVDT